MEIRQDMRPEQQLHLSQSQLQSLELLQMDLQELREHLQEEALSNPLIELSTPPHAETAFSQIHSPDQRRLWDDTANRSTANNWDLVDHKQAFLESIAAPENSFSALLREQLYRMPWQDKHTPALCEYLIDCLDERGYLSFSLSEISEELHVPVFDLEQALYVLQSLQPVGVAARSLEECLILQLSSGRHFNPRTLLLVQKGLPLLAKRDYTGLAELLDCTKAEAKETADIICTLEPIPARGYSTGSRPEYLIPEAIVTVEDGELRIEMNRQFLPALEINQETVHLLQNSGDKAAVHYLKEHLKSAETLLHFVNSRAQTLESIITALTLYQKGFITDGQPLRPLTMSRLAEDLGLSISTVSRAVQGKAIQAQGHIILLKDLFSASIANRDGGVISSSSIKMQLQRFVSAEDTRHPFSDEQLAAALSKVMLPVSRRTVAKYREELGIPKASDRRIPL